MPTNPATVGEFITVLSNFDPNTPMLFKSNDNDPNYYSSAVTVTENAAAPTWDGNVYTLFNKDDCDDFLPAGAIDAVIVTGIC